MRLVLRWLVLVCLGWAAWAPLVAWAQEPLPVPELKARVTDLTGTLSAEQRQRLEDELAAFEAEAGPQIVVLMVATTAPEDIAAYAYRVADSWKVGRREVGDGVLLLVAKDERRVRIEVAKALEGAIPDLAARQIIDRQIRPAFRAGDYAGGLSAAAQALMQRIRGEHLPAPADRSGQGEDSGANWGELLMFFFIGVPVLGGVLNAMLGRPLGPLVAGAGAGTLAWWFTASMWLGGAAGVLSLLLVAAMGMGPGSQRVARTSGRSGRGGVPPVIWGGGGGGGGWGSGGGGGGFSSGGGGDFGGGGASGDW